MKKHSNREDLSAIHKINFGKYLGIIFKYFLLLYSSFLDIYIVTHLKYITKSLKIIIILLFCERMFGIIYQGNTLKT